MFANAAPHAAPRGKTVDFGAGLSPEPRLLWDTLDTTLRERIEHVPFVGEDERVVARRMSGEQAASSLSMEALSASSHEALETLWPASGRDRPSLWPTVSEGTQGCWSWTSPSQPCTTDCRHALDHSDSTCGVFLDCDEASRTVSEAELAAMAEEVPAASLSDSGPGPRIRGALGSEKELIRAAWNYILANLDLVAWAICRVTGEVGDSRYNALLRRLAGQAPYRVTVKVFPVGGAYFALYGTGMIGIPRLNEYFVNNVSMWERGDHATRQCAAMDLAVTLLHELMHLSGYTYVDLGERCYVVYVVDNLFRWALFHRYADATGPDCCTASLRDNLVGCGAVTYVGWNCILDDQPSGVFGGGSEWFRETLWWLITQGATLGIDALTYLHRALIGAIVRGAREFLDWLSGLSGGRSPSGCGCSCQPCYEHCPDLWVDYGGSCQLRDPDDYEAVIRCMQACISMGDSPDEILETSGSGPDGGDGDGQGEWQW